MIVELIKVMRECDEVHWRCVVNVSHVTAVATMTIVMYVNHDL